MKFIVPVIYLVITAFPFTSMGSTHWHIDKDGKVRGGIDAIKNLPRDANCPAPPWNPELCKK
ncbi:hypothetical protein [Arsenophonus nasoniae]|uniref:hypothetical protein n=1 Tax=Arsenophonus nasoniae TaxID=638 RepID=UPI00387A08ED